MLPGIASSPCRPLLLFHVLFPSGLRPPACAGAGSWLGLAGYPDQDQDRHEGRLGLRPRARVLYEPKLQRQGTLPVATRGYCARMHAAFGES